MNTFVGELVTTSFDPSPSSSAGIASRKNERESMAVKSLSSSMANF